MSGACIFISHGTNCGMKWDSEKPWGVCSNGTYHISFFTPAFHNMLNEISNVPLYSLKQGGSNGSLSNKVGNNLYDTKEHLENWKYFVFNNKLPLFLNIVLTIDQHNNSKPYMPWLVDNQYTDEEIYNILNINKEEQNFIEQTLTKYERNSKWFKRYMCGCTK